MNPVRRKLVLTFSLAGLGLVLAGTHHSQAADKPAAAPPAAGAKKPLKVAYSDWPGWTALEIGIQKGWFKEEGIDVEFS